MPEASSADERLLDPVEADRVVRRAIELDLHDVADRADGVSVAALAAAAADVGVDPAAVREAVARERLGPEPTVRRLDLVGGPAVIVAEVTVDRPADETVVALDEWMTRGHHLRRDFDVGGELAWRKRPDLAASMQRAARSFTGDAGLRSQHCVRAAVEPVDDHRCRVRITVRRRAARSVTIGLAGTIGVSSIAAGAVAATVVPPLAIVTAPGLAVAGGVSAVAHRQAREVERELRRLAEQLRATERPRPIGHAVARRLRRRER